MHNTLSSAIASILAALSFCLSPSAVFASGLPDKNISKCPTDDILEAREHYSKEQAKILRSGGDVARNGLRLELRTSKGVVVLKDDCTYGEPYVRYSFENYLKETGYYLVSLTGWEGVGFVLINDRTERRIDLEGAPVVSPDGKRFVAMSLDLEAKYNSNSIQIWRVDSTAPVLEYEAIFDDWGPSEPKWIDNKTIEFKKNILIDAGSRYQSSHALLTKKGGTWTIRQ